MIAMLIKKTNENKKRMQINFASPLFFWLTCQGSNWDSSEPKSDVLPVTPQVSPFYAFFLKTVQKYKFFSFCCLLNIFFQFYCISLKIRVLKHSEFLIFIKPYICTCSKKINHAKNNFNKQYPRLVCVSCCGNDLFRNTRTHSKLVGLQRVYHKRI